MNIHPLRPRDHEDAARVAISWLAERHRWTDGFELPPKEFEQFMNHIQTALKL